MDYAVSMRGVSVVRGGRRILESVDVDIPLGESIAVIGPNGSGKTTFTKLITGEIRPYYDEDAPPELTVFGKGDWSIFDLRRKVSTVSMDKQSDFGGDTSVSEVILSGFFGGNDVYKDDIVNDAMLSSVGEAADRLGVGDLLYDLYENLSLGEKRRVLIARALVTEPKMIILDEPMAGLDPAMRSRFRKMFDILADSGVVMIIVTHDPEDIPVCVDRVVAIKGGRIVADGRKADVITSANLGALYGEELSVTVKNGVYSISYE